ncbi:MAG: hypothetical protein ACRC1I_25230 [Pseudomonas proteolytica]|uniref:hypothetical protein n=1 Tax=Pseudomonas proteolytica TaxID=219574 RepID=UPI003F3B025B
MHPATPLHWYCSVCVKIIGSVPGHALLLIMLMVVSQLSLLSAFFLPIKAIILMGSPVVPDYFPDVLASLGRKTLFANLSIAAISLYLAHLFTEIKIKKLTDAGAKKLILNCANMIPFDDQENFTSRTFSSLTRSLANTLFISVSLILLSIVYTGLFFALLGIGIVAGSVYALLQHASIKPTADILETPNTVASLGFLAAFGFVFYDLLNTTSSNVMTVLIGLLLARQIMQRAAILIQDTHSLMAQHVKISTLLFHTPCPPTTHDDPPDIFWRCLKADVRHSLIGDVICDVTGTAYNIVDSTWHQIAIHDIAAFEVTALHPATAQKHNFLVKFFNSKRKNLALNEATLLANTQHINLPTLAFLGAGCIEHFNCHVFNWSALEKFDPLHIKLPFHHALKSMMKTLPPARLVELFLHSRPLIWDRLTPQNLANFELAIGTTHYAITLRAFMAVRADILRHLKKVPLQIANLDLHKDHLLSDPQGNIYINHWGHWSLEPIGAGWPTSKKELQQLHGIFQEIQLNRDDARHISFQLFTLSVVLSALDRLVAKQHFLSAATLLPLIMAAYTQETARQESLI